MSTLATDEPISAGRRSAEQGSTLEGRVQVLEEALQLWRERCNALADVVIDLMRKVDPAGYAQTVRSEPEPGPRKRHLRPVP